MTKVNLREIFLGLQQQMASRLNANRGIIQHPGTKGDAAEINWIGWLRTYLPNRYSVDKAFIIDSEQIDVVIYDQQYSPFVFNQDGAIYIPAESVYAVFEVKQELHKDYILYAGKKAESVRSLIRTSSPIYHAGGCYPPKVHSEILAGILTLTCSWKTGLSASFEQCIHSLIEKQRINLGCSLVAGSFKINYAESITIEKSNDEEALIFFFLNLLMELNKLGTIPALDIFSYAKALDSI